MGTSACCTFGVRRRALVLVVSFYLTVTTVLWVLPAGLLVVVVLMAVEATFRVIPVFVWFRKGDFTP
jgi:hypothetical protein